MKIGIMGYYPPPIGGITIHVKRLGQLFDTEKINYTIYAIGSKDQKKPHLEIYANRRKWALKYLFQPKEDILHCHTMGWTEKAYYVLLARLFRKISLFTFHSYRDGLATQKGIYKLALKFVRRYGDHFIAVGEDDYHSMVNDGFDQDKISIIPGFIAPKEEIVKIPEYIDAFLKDKEVRLCGNAANMNQYQGQDLYGIDLCIELTAKLRDAGMNPGFVFFLGSMPDKDYYRKLQDRIEELALENHFLFCRESLGFHHIIKSCHVFVRPTNTDGDAVSIREGLYYNKAVIASDVVKRPQGTRVFKNRDLEDLYKVSMSTIRELGVMEPHSLDHVESKDRELNYGYQVIDLYKHLLKMKEEG